MKSAQVAERSRFLESLDRAQAAVEPVVMDAVDQFDLFLTRSKGSSMAAATARAHAARRAGVGGSDAFRPLH